MKKFSVISFTMSLLLLVMFFGVGGVAFAQSIDNIGNDLVKCGGPNDYLHPEDSTSQCYFEKIITEEKEGSNTKYNVSSEFDKPLLNHCQGSDVFGLIHRIVDLIIFTISPAIVVALLIIAGIMMLLASADPALKARSKNAMKYALLGYILVLSAWLIINTFLNVVGVAEWTGLRNWWQIDVNTSGQPKLVKDVSGGTKIKVRGARGGSVALGSNDDNDDIDSLREQIPQDDHYIINNRLYFKKECPSASSADDSTSGDSADDSTSGDTQGSGSDRIVRGESGGGDAPEQADDDTSSGGTSGSGSQRARNGQQQPSTSTSGDSSDDSTRNIDDIPIERQEFFSRRPSPGDSTDRASPSTGTAGRTGKKIELENNAYWISPISFAQYEHRNLGAGQDFYFDTGGLFGDTPCDVPSACGTAQAARCHRGIDFGFGREYGGYSNIEPSTREQCKIEVRAIADGYVDYKAYNGTAGKSVVIEHTDKDVDGTTYYSFYYHLDSFKCEPRTTPLIGQEYNSISTPRTDQECIDLTSSRRVRVNQGDVIGYVGNTGAFNDPLSTHTCPSSRGIKGNFHLHFEMWTQDHAEPANGDHSKLVDPTRIINKYFDDIYPTDTTEYPTESSRYEKEEILPEGLPRIPTREPISGECSKSRW